MAFNPVPLVLFVALCWMSVGTYAQTNTTSAAPNATNVNATTVMASNATTTNVNATTVMAPNATTTNANATTMMAPNATMTNANATTMMAPNATMTNANATTVMAPNATTTNANATTGMGSNATTASANASTTAPSSNTTANNASATTASGSNTTAAANATTAVASTSAPSATTTTTAPPIEANDTVSDLTVSNQYYQYRLQHKKLCAAQPTGCDPSSGSCFFVTAKRSSGFNVDFELSGETDGYLGCTLTPTGGNETAYVCLIKKNKVVFYGGQFLNGKFIRKTQPVNNVRGKLNGRKIQCTFAATVPNATARATETMFRVAVVTGSYNETNDELGTPATQLRTNPVDLTNPTSDTNNTVTTAAPNTTTATAAATTTTVAQTTAGTVPLQSMSTALLIVLGILSLAWL
ncbi:hypothetical protein WMY93_015055 [Mugilogobius chulae]|uniref:Ferric-chelate reductase 1 n=1 Tax=Mugilogobius chulae TaxID=88201 RepID=A0AAW0P0P2_9GOBI